MAEFKQSLQDILEAGQEFQDYIGKSNDISDVIRSEPDSAFGSILSKLPDEGQRCRKKLANAAAQLLQSVTDPKEYLEQLSANVSLAESKS